jgi:hypothetical protein
MSKWEKGPVKLANGEDAFIDAINEGQEGYRYTGRIKARFGDWIAVGWAASGQLMYAMDGHPQNLAPPPKKTVRVYCWLVIYPSGVCCKFYDKADAIVEAKALGFALIEIDREVTEGEGLS